MKGAPIVEVEVDDYVVLVQRIDYGSTAEVRPSYRAVVRRAASDACWRPRIGHVYLATTNESTLWSWGDTVEDLDAHRRIEAAVERTIASARAELDAELDARLSRRGMVDHG